MIFSMIEPLLTAAAAEYDPLPEPAVRRLVHQARQGGALGRAAMQQLILRNIHQIQVVVSHYRSQTTAAVTPDDLFQIACLGLMQAVHKFDPQRGIKFITYATVSMRRTLRRALDNHARPIRIPVHLQRRLIHTLSVTSQLTAAGRPPTRAELAQASGLTETKLIHLTHLPRVTASLDEPYGEKEQTTLGEQLADSSVIAPEVDLETRLARAALLAWLQHELSPRSYLILSLYFGFDPRHPGGLNTSQIAQHLGVTQQAINQNLHRTTDRLRTNLSAQLLTLLHQE